MELKEFITEALSQIVEGVSEAQKRLSNSGAEINPKVLGTSDMIAGNGGGIRTQSENFAQIIEFDVAVTATEGSGKKGGIGIVAGPVTIGTAGHSNLENSSISKIKFNVPLALPRA